MHRRIAWVIVGVVLATLFVASATIGVLSAWRAPETARADLAEQAEAVATRLDQRILGTTPREQLVGAGCGTLSALREIDCGLVRLDGALQLNARNASETGLPVRVDPAGLEDNQVVSGRSGRVVYAIIPIRASLNARGNPTGFQVIVLSERVRSPLQPVRGWFMLATILTLALGLLAAWLLSRRLTRPLADAQAATQRIAAGDLTARLASDGDPNDELVGLARSINQMAAALERSKVVEQQFLLSVSHDLRTPLTSIRGYAEALGDGTLTDVGKGAAVIEREASRLERLVRDLLDLAKLDARAFRFEPQVLDLAAMAQRAVEALAPGAAAEGVTLSSTLAPLAPDGGDGPPVAVVADRDRLAQVIANLIENALKFATTRVVVSTGMDATTAWLTVADDGPGIAPEDRPHIFERLYVSKHAPVRKEVGSGLGLAIVGELTTAMGGRVEVSANQPHGTVMWLTFPRSVPPGPTAPTPPTAET